MDVNVKSPNKTTPRRWVAALIAMVLGLTGVGLVSAPAAAATAPIQLTDLVANDYHIPDRAMALGGDMRITGEWSTPAATAPGDTFVVTMPGFLYTFTPLHFQLTGAGDDFATTYALCDSAASRITCTFTDAAAAGAADGYFWFRASMIGLHNADRFTIDVDGTTVPVSSPGGVALPESVPPTAPDVQCWFTTATSIQTEMTFRGGVSSGSQGPSSDVWGDPKLLIVAYAPVANYMGGANFIVWKDAPLTSSFDGARLTWTLGEGVFNNSDYVLRIQTTAVQDVPARSGDWASCDGTVGTVPAENISYFLPNGLDSHDGIARVVDPIVTQPTCDDDGAVVEPSVVIPRVAGMTYTYSGEIVSGGSIRVLAHPARFWMLRIADPGWGWESAGRAVKKITFDKPPCVDTIAVPAPVVVDAVCSEGTFTRNPGIYGTRTRGIYYLGDRDYAPGETAHLIAAPREGVTLVGRDGWVLGPDGRATYTVEFPPVDCTSGLTTVTPQDPTVIPAHEEATEVVPTPEPTVPAEPEPTVPTVPAEPEPTVPAEPEPTVPAEPEPTVPAEPEPMVPAEPEPTVPAEPEPTVPVPASEIPAPVTEPGDPGADPTGPQPESAF